MSEEEEQRLEKMKKFILGEERQSLFILKQFIFGGDQTPLETDTVAWTPDRNTRIFI